MIQLAEVQAAQRTAPDAPETKALQRAYETQRTAARRAQSARESLERIEADRAEDSRLRAAIAALDLRPYARGEDGSRLVGLSYRTAAWAGMAPRVAGGWVAITLPLAFGRYVALVPETWTEGMPLSPSDVRALWLRGAIDNDDLRTAFGFLSQLTKEGK